MKNKEEKKEDLGEGLYAGKKLKDMTRQELYEAIYNHDQLYQEELKHHEA